MFISTTTGKCFFGGKVAAVSWDPSLKILSPKLALDPIVPLN